MSSSAFLSNILQNFINNMEKRCGVAISDSVMIARCKCFPRMIANSLNTNVKVTDVITVLLLITQLEN